MGPAPRPEPHVVVGVCHVSARVTSASEPHDLVLSVAMTTDVTRQESTTTVVTGVDAACLEVRRWAALLCAPVTNGRA